MHWLTLIGILIVIVGFALRLNTLLVVVVAGIVTGLVAGISFNHIMAQFGQLFIQNRYMSLPVILTLPVIGLLEHYGLKERAETLVRRAKAATTGRVLMSYLFVREWSSAIGLNIGGHAQTVRPLVVPMAEGAATAQYGPLPEHLQEKIKAHAAASENIGWFFGEDIFIATGAILLMKGYFDSVGMHISVWNMALWGIPTAICAYLLFWWRSKALDREIRNTMTKTTNASNSDKKLTTEV